MSTMALSLIGAGFGRTGTDSMRQALETIGMGPCHHMKEVNDSAEQTALWRAVAGGGAADWQQIFSSYQSSIDWPSAYYWRELSATYPDAKILLTVRSAESWYDSMSKTICKVIRTSNDPQSLGVNLIGNQVFSGRYDEREHAIAVFEKNNADVRATFPPERLLVYRLGDGWEPLCRFLDKPVPDTPFPHTNSAREFNDMVTKMDQESS